MVDSVIPPGPGRRVSEVMGWFEGHRVRVLIDSGASCTLISSRFVRRVRLSPFPSSTSTRFEFADGGEFTSTLSATGHLTLGDYSITLQDVSLCELSARADIILGEDWLREANPEINWRTGQICVGDVVLVAGKKERKEEPEVVSGVTAAKDSRSETTALSAGEREKEEKGGSRGEGVATKEQKVERITAKAMERMLRKHRDQVAFVATVWSGAQQVDTAAEKGGSSTLPGQRDKVTALLSRFQDVFQPPQTLPPLRTPEQQHGIELEADTKPPAVPPYHLSWKEEEELHKILRELEEQGLITPSTSPFAAPVLLVRKKDGSSRMVVDYRLLNKKTVRDCYPLPRIHDLLDKLVGASVFTKIDLKSGYWQVRMKEEDEHKTSFTTPFGTYQFRVLPMGLTNAPSTFQRVMERMLSPYLRKFVLVYLDDLLIYSNNEEEHLQHLEAVLTTLRQHKFFLNKEKCDIAQISVIFLGHTVGKGTVGVEEEKVRAMRNWAVPKTRTEVQRFLGFANFYRRFLRDFAHVAAPLTDSLRGSEEGPFVMTDEARAAFRIIRDKLCQAPTLAMPRPDLPFTLTVDASDKAVAAVLQQDQGRGLQLVACASQRFDETAANYPIRDKEFYAQVFGIEHFRTYLMGNHFTLQTDHESLKGLATGSQQITGRLARWVERLQDYHFTVEYIKGENNVADGLTRCGGEEQVAAVVSKAQVVRPEWGVAQLREEPYFSEIIQALEGQQPTVSLTVMQRAQRFHIRDDFLFHLDSNGVERCCVPAAARKAVWEEAHRSRIGGHQGVDRTYEALRKIVFWPKMVQQVQRWCRECDECQRGKQATKTIHAPAQPLDVPTEPWKSVSMDFMDLPMSLRGHDSVLITTCRFSGMLHVLPTTKTVTADGAADLVLQGVVRLHGVPESFVSDRDPRFVAELWQQLWTKMGTQLRMTTAHRPQADGKAEASNKLVQTALRHFVNAAGSDWDAPAVLSLVELGLNMKKQRTTGLSAFEAVQGTQPQVPLQMASATQQDQGKKEDGKLAQLRRVWGRVEDAVEMAKEQQAAQQDEVLPPTIAAFAVGDEVLLNTANYPSLRPHKLAPLFKGPYKVRRVLSPAVVELELPHDCRISPTINVDQLKRYHRDQDAVPPPGAVWTNSKGQSYFDVDKVLDKRKRGKGWQYLVRWKGYTPESDSWEPQREIGRLKEIVQAYELTLAVKRAPKRRSPRGHASSLADLGTGGGGV